MAEVGVVALDPPRLDGLAVYLESLRWGCRQGASTVTEALAGTGFNGAEEVAALTGLSDWCLAQSDDVRSRLAQIEALPTALPLARLLFPPGADRRALGAALGARLQTAVDGDRRTWGDIQALLAEIARGVHDPRFAAGVVSALRPKTVRDMPQTIERLAMSASRGEGRAGLDAPVITAQRQWTAAVGAAARSHGDDGPDDEWLEMVFGPVARLDQLDQPVDPDTGRPDLDGIDGDLLLELVRTYGLRAGRWIAARMAMGGLVAALGPVGQVLMVSHLGTHIGVGEPNPVSIAFSVGSGLTLYAAGTAAAAGAGPILVAAGVGLGVLAFASTLLAPHPGPPPDRRRVHNPGTGRSTYRGGGGDSPHQDGAGGVLPPNMIR